VARGLGSFMDYYYLLKYSEDRGEWSSVMDALAVHETYFWREIDQLRAVVEIVIPQLAREGAQALRIWSVPCATGEEPLTLAMLLKEAGWFARLPIELIASDASPEAVRRAKEGRYGQRSFRNLPAALHEKYFIRDDTQWAVVPDLHQRISYDIVNLVAEDEIKRHASAPIVFCRNVFIYFSDESIRRVMSVFERYLCVGASESLLRRTVSFELQDIGGAFMYVKNGRGKPSRPTATEMERAS
jgi:chemotaxis protein methyltransferase CheR